MFKQGDKVIHENGHRGLVYTSDDIDFTVQFSDGSYGVFEHGYHHGFTPDDFLTPISGFISNEKEYDIADDCDFASEEETTRDYNVGNSDYSKHNIQPWDIWLEYSLNPWDADIIKRVLRTKEGDERSLDYEKIIHICKERIRQLDRSEEIRDIVNKAKSSKESR